MFANKTIGCCFLEQFNGWKIEKCKKEVAQAQPIPFTLDILQLVPTNDGILTFTFLVL